MLTDQLLFRRYGFKLELIGQIPYNLTNQCLAASMALFLCQLTLLSSVGSPAFISMRVNSLSAACLKKHHQYNKYDTPEHPNIHLSMFFTV